MKDFIFFSLFTANKELRVNVTVSEIDDHKNFSKRSKSVIIV